MSIGSLLAVGFLEWGAAYTIAAVSPNAAHSLLHPGVRFLRRRYHGWMTRRWNPSVTAAAIIERNGRYLLVEEQTSDGLRLNNPAGHLDPGESPAQCAAREALEESGWVFAPRHLVGVYLARFIRASDGRDTTYVRFAFAGEAGEPQPGWVLDDGIVRTLWLTPEEIRASVARHRSPLVLRCMEDHLAGRRFPLDAVHTDASVFAPTRTH
jgi:8-oxo-dGTP pyrophosphatase MutT (NUDIX family)